MQITELDYLLKYADFNTKYVVSTQYSSTCPAEHVNKGSHKLKLFLNFPKYVISQ